MKQVAVFEAKTRLSELLSEVEEGHSVTITRRGRPIARLVPVTGDDPRQVGQRQEVAAIFAALKRARKGVVLDGDIRDVIADGRD